MNECSLQPLTPKTSYRLGCLKSKFLMGFGASTLATPHSESCQSIKCFTIYRGFFLAPNGRIFNTWNFVFKHEIKLVGFPLGSWNPLTI